MSTIRQAVAPHIRGYESHAEAALAALEARESAAVANLIQAARNAGIDRAEASRAITEAGFQSPVLVNETAPAGPDVNAVRRVASQLQSEISQAFARAGQALGL